MEGGGCTEGNFSCPDISELMVQLSGEREISSSDWFGYLEQLLPGTLSSSGLAKVQHLKKKGRCVEVFQDSVVWSGLALVVAIFAVEFAGLHTTRASLGRL